MQKNQAGFSIVELLLVIIAVCVIGGIGWLVYTYKMSGPLSVDDLKAYRAEEVNAKSQASESELRREVDALSLASFGLNIEGEAYADYCDQDNATSVPFNKNYIKQCDQRLVLYLSSSSDVQPVNDQLIKLFQGNGRAIHPYTGTDTCKGGQVTLLDDAPITYSNSGSIARANHISGEYIIRPAGQPISDEQCNKFKIQDIASADPKDNRYFNTQTTFDEARLQNLKSNQKQSIIILALYRTYFAEKIR